MASQLQALIEERSPIIGFISDMIERNNISLRETERLVRFLEIYHSLSHGLGNVIWQYALLRITGVFIFCFHPNLIGDINKNRTEAKDFAQLFNLQSLSNIPTDKLNWTDVIAMMLIMYSKIEDKRFIFQEFYGSDLDNQINGDFLQNPEIYPQGIDGVFSILKDTFRVLSLEQTPQ
jgi:KAP family P-loop domain-containing protein